MEVSCATEVPPTPHSDTLVCIPCYNAEETILECIEPFRARDDTHILLVDDHSDRPLRDFIKENCRKERCANVTVVRPESKVYAEGGRNLGIRKALEDGYQLVVFVDSDIVAKNGFLEDLRGFLAANPHEIVVSATIEPYGSGFQYADTLINFSRYLPRSRPEIGRTGHLASYAFALNFARFREHPCFFESSHDQDGVWWSAEDLRFFDTIKRQFAVADFPILNRLSVEHKHPRSNLRRAFQSQQRYARAMLRSGYSRYGLANAVPLLHLLTPRFWFMVLRLLQRGRLRDLRYLPVCWLLDFYRATHTMRLLWKSGQSHVEHRNSPQDACK